MLKFSEWFDISEAPPGAPVSTPALGPPRVTMHDKPRDIRVGISPKIAAWLDSLEGKTRPDTIRGLHAAFNPTTAKNVTAEDIKPLIAMLNTIPNDVKSELRNHFVRESEEMRLKDKPEVVHQLQNLYMPGGELNDFIKEILGTDDTLTAIRKFHRVLQGRDEKTLDTMLKDIQNYTSRIKSDLVNSLMGDLLAQGGLNNLSPQVRGNLLMQAIGEARNLDAETAKNIFKEIIGGMSKRTDAFGDPKYQKLLFQLIQNFSPDIKFGIMNDILKDQNYVAHLQRQTGMDLSTLKDEPMFDPSGGGRGVMQALIQSLRDTRVGEEVARGKVTRRNVLVAALMALGGTREYMRHGSRKGLERRLSQSEERAKKQHIVKGLEILPGIVVDVEKTPLEPTAIAKFYIKPGVQVPAAQIDYIPQMLANHLKSKGIDATALGRLERSDEEGVTAQLKLHIGGKFPGFGVLSK